MPPVMMFLRKQRPKGLEFPSCRECNNGTSKSDLVASFVGRLSVDPSTEDAAAEVKRLFRSVRNNVPGLLQEMHIGRAGQKLAGKTLPLQEGGGVVRTNGPLVTKHMLVFGAKLGFALHYEALQMVVPETGGVQPRWFSNAQAARGEIPKELFSLLPATRHTLKQGRREVSNHHLGDHTRGEPCPFLRDLSPQLRDSSSERSGPHGFHRKTYRQTPGCAARCIPLSAPAHHRPQTTKSKQRLENSS
jgi:hypothetical protein